MSEPNKTKEKSPDLESAVKADSESLKKNTDTEKSMKTPLEQIGDAIDKNDPIDRICNQTGETDFEGTIEFTEEDLDSIVPNSDGRKIYEFFQLDAPEEFEDWIYLQTPIMGNELALDNEVYVTIIIPYISRVPFEEALENGCITEETPFIILNDEFLEVARETFEQYRKALRYIGYPEDHFSFEGEDDDQVMEKIVEMVQSAQAREDGYYDDLMEYWYAGRMYHEKDAIWVNLRDLLKDPNQDPDQEQEERPQTLGATDFFVFNADLVGVEHTPINISGVKDVKVENFRRVLSAREQLELEDYEQNRDLYETLTPNEEVWYLATEQAKKENDAGVVVVCLNGKFYMPVETKINPHTSEVEGYISLFNAVPCFTTHHACIGDVVLDVGNMQVHTGVRYLKGRHIDWNKRIEQELKAYRMDSEDYDPFGDPYDNLVVTVDSD